jgi:hypothetical protein
MASGNVATVYIRRTDLATNEPGGRFTGVDVPSVESITVDQLVKQWIKEQDVRASSSYVSLRLTKANRRPTAEEEATAELLDDPSLTLAAVGVKNGSWIVADVPRSGTNGALVAVAYSLRALLGWCRYACANLCVGMGAPQICAMHARARLCVAWHLSELHVWAASPSTCSKCPVLCVCIALLRLQHYLGCAFPTLCYI